MHDAPARAPGKLPRGRFDRFVALDRLVDDLARYSFKAPMEGYIQRMLWCLVHQGVIPEEAAATILAAPA